jgi:predicted MFS family arabinose efflux permease
VVNATHSRREKNTVLAMLLAVLAFNYTDGQVFALVLQSIKTDLKLSDTQLGALSGLAFAAFYAMVGIPIARIADRGNRVMVISATTAIWSVFVAACGGATSFFQLFLARVGVAVGEAGCLPPAQSLLADVFPRAERTRAFSIYALGSPLSVILGGFVAGWINQYYGWRVTFVVLGLPGTILALLAWLILKEPRLTPTRDGEHDTASPPAQRPAQESFKAVVGALARNSTFRQVVVANTMLYFCIYGTLQWQASFFIRTHGLTTGELGTWELMIWAVMGTLGTYGGGALVHRYMPHDERRQLRLISGSVVLFCLFTSLVYLSSNKYVALGSMALAAPFYTAIFGPIFGVNQAVVAQNMRATAAALLLFFANLIGMGLGGFAIGRVSDALAPIYGSDSLRYALLGLSPGFCWCALHFWRASQTVALDVKRAQCEPAPT